MSGKRSRWDDGEDDDEAEDEDVIRKKKEKHERRKAKLKKQAQEPTPPPPPHSNEETPPVQTANTSVREPLSQGFIHSKRRKLSPLRERTFPIEPPNIRPCRNVDVYEKLNHIEEGTYGIVYRARENATGEIVALKKLKLDREKNGFPITSLREISTLMAARHPNIVNIREVVMGDTLTPYGHLYQYAMADS
jgi:cell division cycle 2-like protein